jgi:acyl-CoA dehydrogenase
MPYGVVAAMWELVTLIVCLAGGLALAARRAPLWIWALVVAAIALAWQIGLPEGHVEIPSFGLLSLLGWLPAVAFGALAIPMLRRSVLVAPAFRFIRRALPRLSEVARQSAGAGTIGFDAEFFGGRPDWDKLRAVPPITLTDEERAFLDGATEQLCRMIDDWRIRHDQDIPDEVWRFLKEHHFFGLRIAKQHGGLGFSAQALSLVLGKVASRSPDVFTIIMIPNSLGLGELIETYGTDEQKRHHLPRLARGDDIPCLALTGPASGSDAAAMRDIGTVTRGRYQGADTLGIRVSWDKRYITLAPNATLLGLAFHLFDPENLLGKGEDVGITVALVPADHPGVVIGARHLSAGTAFPIGPTSGKDVFIPLAWVLGGDDMAGQAWRMLMECVSASRAIALPSCAAAGAKSMLRVSTAYGRIRRQFRSPIAKMEALEEPLARMVEAAYVSEAGRAVTASMVSRGEKPAVISALMKYQTTERLRGSVNDAMDLHAGRAICDGPANYLQSAYQMVPAAVTVEGANIVTRALITATQGALMSHPYLGREMRACQDADERRGLAAFEHAILDHVSFALSNAAGAFIHNLTAGWFAKVPARTPGTARWYRQLWRASRNFAFVADVSIVLLGAGGLRIRQKITGRLADALSELYLLACALKRHEDDGMPAEDRPIVAFAAQNGFYRFQEALRGTIDNFPVAWARRLMKIVVFPLGAPYRPAPDRLGHKIVGLVLEPGELRDRLTRYIYLSTDPNEPTGLLEVALEKAIRAENAEKKVDRAVRRGLVRRYHGIDWIGGAAKQGVISEGEAELLREVEALAARVIAVDHFDPDAVRPNYMTPGHNTRAAQGAAAE